MTVEQLIELLQREYPQALVQIEVTGIPKRLAWNPFRECLVLDPYHVQRDGRLGIATILCAQHDC